MELHRKFYIDNGELEGLSPQEIFITGFETGKFAEAMDSLLGNTPTSIHDMLVSLKSFQMLVNEWNFSRLKKMAEDKKLLVEKLDLSVPSDDWCEIKVSLTSENGPA